MSLAAFVWVYNATHITDPQARLVLYAMAEHASADGSRCFPSITTIAKATSLSERTIRAKLRWLEENGHIQRGDERFAAILFPRADRRPRTYNLVMSEGQLSPAVETGGKSRSDGGQITLPRGATAAPKPSTNQKLQPGTPISPQGDKIPKREQPEIGKENYTPAFEAFWSVYPKAKAGSKWSAFRRWETLRLGVLPADQRAAIIGDIIDRTKRHRAWLDGYIPHAATYLNARGWTAEIDTTTPAGNGHESKHERNQRANQFHEQRLRDEFERAGGHASGDDIPL
jgi:hypothetical protein